MIVRLYFMRLIQQKHCFWSISELWYDVEIAAAATAAAAAAAAKYSYQCKQCKFSYKLYIYIQDASINLLSEK